MNHLSMPWIILIQDIDEGSKQKSLKFKLGMWNSGLCPLELQVDDVPRF